MKNKVLFVASIPEHFKAFHLPYLKWFKEQGIETHVACNGRMDLPFVDYQWQIDIQRSPFSLKNIKAYKQLKSLINGMSFSIIHCHTPVASVITRLAGKKCRGENTKILYTAHGFHFYKGAPTLNWCIFYPLEIYLSRLTDVIITINKEDFDVINANGYSKTDYYMINGIGVDSTKFNPVSDIQKNILKKEKGFSTDKLCLIYAAEYISRKNHQFIIDAVRKKTEYFENIEILFAGRGILEENLKRNVEDNGLKNIVKFIGFRKDINEVFQAADVIISPSKQEGLPINIIEGMFTGLPIIATEIRGHTDLVKENINGFTYKTDDMNSFFEIISKLNNNFDLVKKMGKESLLMAQKFEIENSLQEMSKIYRKFL